MFLVSDSDVPGVKVVNHKSANAGGGYDEWKAILQKETKGFDVAFFQYQREGQIPFEAIDTIPKDIIKIAWSGDVRNNVFDWQIELSKHMDIITFSSGETTNQMKEYADNSYWFDIWYDDDIFHPVKTEKDIDIVFMANNYSQFPLSDYREKVVKFLRDKYGDRAKVYGNGWGHRSDGEMNANQPKQNEIYNRSKIAINLSNFEHGNYSSDRILRAMGSGCFVLSHWYPKMPFKNHKHLAVFRDLTDLEYKINYFLKNEIRREKMRTLGYYFVRKYWSKYGVKDRIENLIKEANNLQPAKPIKPIFK